MHKKTGLEIYQHIKQLRKGGYLASGKTETLKNKEDEVWVSYDTIRHLIEKGQKDMTKIYPYDERVKCEAKYGNTCSICLRNPHRVKE